MTLPLAGHPCGIARREDAEDPRDLIQSAYRFLLADLFPFGKNARITLEHGGENQSEEHYETVTYWYGLPGASVVKSDSLALGDVDAEHAHGFSSPNGSEPYTIRSRYELGIDRSGEEVTHSELEMSARKTSNTCEFTLALNPDNFGVLLRRTLDYAYMNQRAEIFIADASDGRAIADADFNSAGIWYTAGSSACVYSDPKGELGATQHNVVVSNRRFRDDEFLVAKSLTRGRGAIRVRVVPTPRNVPLFPGYPLSESAWTAIGYDAYCFVMPTFSLDDH
jgi:hypothetical protein